MNIAFLLVDGRYEGCERAVLHEVQDRAVVPAGIDAAGEFRGKRVEGIAKLVVAHHEVAIFPFPVEIDGVVDHALQLRKDDRVDLFADDFDEFSLHGLPVDSGKEIGRRERRLELALALFDESVNAFFFFVYRQVLDRGASEQLGSEIVEFFKSHVLNPFFYYRLLKANNLISFMIEKMPKNSNKELIDAREIAKKAKITYNIR
jgi:hypothetical protein